MPTISRFYGINIEMYWYDHQPPHFHAIYAGEDATVSIPSGEVRCGRLPPRIARFVREWTEKHILEIWEDWRRGQNGETFLPIEPLD